MSKKNLRRISVLVTAQTAYNLKKLAAGENLTEGQMIDMMVCSRLFTNRIWANTNKRIKEDRSKPFSQAWSEATREEIKRSKGGAGK